MHTYIDSSKEINCQDPKLKIDDIVKISKYESNFAKGCVSNWSEEVFKNTASWTYVIGDLKREETAGTFYKKELQKANQKEFRVEKVIKRKGEWKAYNNSFNSCINKKDIV